MSANDFDGKRVFITGGSKGVGEAIVRHFSVGGATVGTTARSPLPEGNAAKLFVQADISTRVGVDTVVQGVLNRFGGLDILIHNAGGSGAPGGGALALSDADWQDALDMNLLTAVRLDRGFLPSMLEQGSGVIIHIS
jgi:NAD(P)-dependent dehydrogenase (short-subunit alcohol dehydrogenase family)